MKTQHVRLFARHTEGGEGEKDFKTLYENAVKARDEERTQRQALAKSVEELSTKLSAIEKEKTDNANLDSEKKLKEKQKFDELETKWKEEKTALEKQVADLTPIVEAHNTRIKGEYEKLTAQIPEAKKDFVNSLIAGKSPEETIAVLPKILEEFKAPSFGGAPNGGTNGNGNGGGNGAQGGDTATKVANAGSFGEGLTAIFNTASDK